MTNFMIKTIFSTFMILLSVNSFSHHAFTAEFDANAPVNLTGKVLKVEWINPHAWVHMEVEEEGKKTTWMVEGGTPNTLIRNGITKQSIKPGTVIVVRGYQSKGKLCLPRCIANGRDVTFQFPIVPLIPPKEDDSVCHHKLYSYS